MESLLFWVGLWAALAAVGAYIATQKGRGSLEGAGLAVLFGPLGLLLEALLPSRNHMPVKPVGRRPRADDEVAIDLHELGLVSEPDDPLPGKDRLFDEIRRATGER